MVGGSAGGFNVGRTPNLASMVAFEHAMRQQNRPSTAQIECTAGTDAGARHQIRSGIIAEHTVRHSQVLTRMRLQMRITLRPWRLYLCLVRRRIMGNHAISQRGIPRRIVQGKSKIDSSPGRIGTNICRQNAI